MGISCGSCSDWDDFSYYPPDDFGVLETKRGRRCWSCGDRIKVGDDCGKFSLQRCPKDEIEERIYGEEADDIPMADKYMCETCTGLYFTIEELGFCITMPADMREEVRIAADIIAAKRAEAA